MDLSSLGKLFYFFVWFCFLSGLYDHFFFFFSAIFLFSWGITTSMSWSRYSKQTFCSELKVSVTLQKKSMLFWIEILHRVQRTKGIEGILLEELLLTQWWVNLTDKLVPNIRKHASKPSMTRKKEPIRRDESKDRKIFDKNSYNI